MVVDAHGIDPTDTHGEYEISLDLIFFFFFPSQQEEGVVRGTTTTTIARNPLNQSRFLLNLHKNLSVEATFIYTRDLVPKLILLCRAAYKKPPARPPARRAEVRRGGGGCDACMLRKNRERDLASHRQILIVGILKFLLEAFV